MSLRSKSKYVTVTGANGFIASHIIKILLEKGYHVRGTVRDTSNPEKINHLKNLPNANRLLDLFEAELCDDSSFDEIFKGCACVFHTASPVIKKPEDPINELIKPAVEGTLKVLKSCESAGVESVVLTSSMSAVAPRPEPPVKSEEHWSNPDEQKKRGSWYGASKTLAEKAAVDFVEKMPQENRIRLVRVCPTWTVGPMLQPTTNFTMKRFAECVSGTALSQIPNDSISFIDVRDTAAHHVAAFEGEHVGRFMSVVESWHWREVIALMKSKHPKMPLPKQLETGTAIVRPTQFDNSRMKSLLVSERSMKEVIEETLDYCRLKGLLTN